MKRPSLLIYRRLDGGGIELRVTHDRKIRRYSLGEEVAEEDWDERAGRFARTYPSWRMKNEALIAVLAAAGDMVDEIMRRGEGFDHDTFRSLFRPAGDTKPPLAVSLIRAIEKEMADAAQVGNANLYNGIALRVEAFDKKVRIDEITVPWLNRFHGFLQRTCGPGGIRQYMSTLRSVVNRAITEGHVPAEAYPFGKRGYQVDKNKSAKRPRPLSDEGLELVKDYPTRGYWYFDDQLFYFRMMYYARGMNFADIAHLKWSMIYENRIHYTRRKTMRKGSGANFTVLITPEIQAILDQFPRGTNEYVFRILHHERHVTALQQRNRVNKCRAHLNSTMRKVAAELGIDMNVTSYVARHTFGAVLLRKGVSKRELGDAYGHTDSATTEHYAEQLVGAELDHLQKLL